MGARRGRLRLLWAAVAIPLLAAGCFRRGPELALVKGIVTLDGQPLAGAQIEFQHGRWAPAYGTTNSLGQYELQYTKDKRGAPVGTNIVRITTETTRIDETGKEIQVPDRVPERYNYRTELRVQVKPQVENVINFDLSSQPGPDESPEGGAEAQPPGQQQPEGEKPASGEARKPEAAEKPGGKVGGSEDSNAESP